MQSEMTTSERNTDSSGSGDKASGAVGTAVLSEQDATFGHQTFGEQPLRPHSYNTRRRDKSESPSGALNENKKRGASSLAGEEDRLNSQSKSRKKRSPSHFSQLNELMKQRSVVNHMDEPPNLRHCVLRESVATRPIDWSLYQELDAETVPVPDFQFLVNFVNRETSRDSTMRCCVMCGNYRPYANNKAALGTEPDGDENDIASGYIIPSQNKGICTACDIAVWVIVDHPNHLEIKWCKGCKNFRPWVAFGEKVMATKCEQCRMRQKLKYKEQKILKLMPSAGKTVEKSHATPRAAEMYLRRTAADAFAADVLGNLSRAAQASPSFGSAYVKAVALKNSSPERG